ncbi:hypothetical protein [Rariglobus hedericola]|uniref:Uncharacterized protein n=1 Tax=Rariglobus hedericola TaxID=2597822 RepID=A0A556QKC8_9BACT|nr:hypothetical protein [Rariglobus hedericola]TSJ77062.1 hypothetical protein FPL22_13240 [Rariglobus hedericola]
MKPVAPKSYLSTILLAVVLLVLLAGILIPTLGRVKSVPRGPDSSNIRQIGQASLIYMMSNNDRFPEATHVWDFARQLAESGGLDVASMWQSKVDPAFNDSADVPRTVLVPGDSHPRQLDPLFRQIKPCIAVPLGKLTNEMPSSTPIAWTRGLQLDGTWAKHSPYGTDGGYIVFMGGNVAFYRNLISDDDKLLRFDGKGKTSNILDALPPGCRIGEYVPTLTEQSEWAKR